MPTTAAECLQERRVYAARVPIEARRAQLRAAALRLIAQSGYRGLAANAVATAAGVTQPVLYGAYENLEALFADLLEHTQTQILTDLVGAFGAVPEPGGSGSLASRVTREWLRSVGDHPDAWRPVLCAGAGTPQTVADRFEAGRRAVRDLIAVTLRDASKAGRDAVHFQLGAEAVIAAAEHFGRVLIAGEATFSEGELVRIFEGLVSGLYRTGQ